MTQERIWNERLGWIAADGTIEREAGIKKEPPMTTDELCRRFTYRKGSRLSRGLACADRAGMGCEDGGVVVSGTVLQNLCGVRVAKVKGIPRRSTHPTSMCPIPIFWASDHP